MTSHSRKNTEGIKVLFRVDKDGDGYPENVDVESVWGTVEGQGVRIENVPFYVRGIAWGDVVEVTHASDGSLEYSRVLKRSGHSTYRLLLPDRHQALNAMEELVQRGLGVEQDVDVLLSVDVPPETDLKELRAFFIRERDRGRWELQEAHAADA